MNLADIFRAELGQAPEGWPQDIPAASIRDDDWYVIDAETNRLIRIASGKSPVDTKPGELALRGMSIKCRGIQMWKRAIPDFLLSAI